MSTLASQVPWYPEGFFEIKPGFAGKWVTRTPSCYSCRAWTLDVISRTTCSSGVYVEINVLDKASRRVVDWTNDSLPYLEAYQEGRLELRTYASGSITASITEARC
jgi:hypothetical protein